MEHRPWLVVWWQIWRWPGLFLGPSIYLHSCMCACCSLSVLWPPCLYSAAACTSAPLIHIPPEWEVSHAGASHMQQIWSGSESLNCLCGFFVIKIKPCEAPGRLFEPSFGEWVNGFCSYTQSDFSGLVVWVFWVRGSGWERVWLVYVHSWKTRCSRPVRVQL